MEPTLAPAVGLGELQTMRLLLDTCATVEEAKETLRGTKQYYQYVPVHYLVADRNGKAFIWEYSGSHNKEYIMESPGEALVMTNFTLSKRLEQGKLPAAEAASTVCRRYAFLREKLAAGSLDDQGIRTFHEKVDCQLAPAADPSRPPIRTFWHAFYYPEDRRVRLSFYLKDEPIPGNDRRIRAVRTEYLEFELEPTAGAAQPATPAASATPAVTQPPRRSGPAGAIEAAGGTVKGEGERVVSVGLEKVTNLDAVLPLLAQLPDLEELNLGNTAVIDANVRVLQGMSKLRSLGLMSAPIGDDALAVVKTLPALRVLNVSQTKVTDAGLVHLRDLTALQYLGLKGTGITDAGLAHVASLTGLDNLNLADTKVTDAGLEQLAGMRRLESLNLSNDTVTDAGLAKLGRLIGLAGLNLSGTKVTDAGLVHLKQFPKLTKLNLTGTAVTEQGVRDAKQFLPFWITVTR
jgi:hypothetical protein